MDETRTAKRRPSSRNAAPVATIQLVYSGDIVHEAPLRLARGELIIGRAPPEGGLTLDDELASRSHAELRWTGKALQVRDLASRNGTFVNGLQVERSKLLDGDLLRVGDSFFITRLRPRAKASPDLPELLGQAPSLTELSRTLELVAPTDATVVLLGESGVGKGQSAKALHRLSARSGPFVAINCAAIPANLAESTLFGHRAGSFTGARREEPGYFRAAQGGTLFVDEIAELESGLQAKLLHAIEDKAVVPVGGTKPVTVDVRLVAATSVDLQKAVKDGRFRGDLYARLSEIVVQLPPLRARREDVLLLLEAFLEGAPPISPELAELLLLHEWPFNVRELKNVAVELRVKGRDLDELGPELIEHRFDEPESTVEPAAEPVAEPPPSEPPSPDELRALLSECGGVVSEVARRLGRSRRHVYRWLDKHGIDPAEHR